MSMSVGSSVRIRITEFPPGWYEDYTDVREGLVGIELVATKHLLHDLRIILPGHVTLGAPNPLFGYEVLCSLLVEALAKRSPSGAVRLANWYPTVRSVFLLEGIVEEID